jgi:hypothetical protein
MGADFFGLKRKERVVDFYEWNCRRCRNLKLKKSWKICGRKFLIQSGNFCRGKNSRAKNISTHTFLK